MFCGECGAPVAAPAGADRAARLPRPPNASGTPGAPASDAFGRGFRRANTLVGARPGIPVGAGSAPPVPGMDRRTVTGMPTAPVAEGTRVPAVTMVSPVLPTDRETKVMSEVAKPQPGGRSGKRGRRGSSAGEEAVPRSEAKPVVLADPPPPPPSEDAPLIEVSSVEAPSDEAPKPPAVADTPKPPAGKAPKTMPPPKPIAQPAPTAGAKPAPAAGSQPGRASSPPQDADDTQRLLDDLDAGFESIVRPSAPGVWIGSPGSAPPAETAPEPSGAARAARHEADMDEVRALFAGIAVAYARPLRDFMIEVAWGEPTKEWLDVALPAAQALRRAAAAVELPGVDAALDGYMTAIELAMGESSVNTEVREMLAGAYAKLIAAMPNVFALEGERVRREPVIVRALLLQVPGVRHVAIHKLYLAGLNGLDVFYAARPRELAEATGLDESVAAAICERFQRYRRELAEMSPGKDRATERADLAQLTDELARWHEAHERAASGWSADAQAQRAKAREERAGTVLRIDVLLAHLGEVDLQRHLARVPFQQKIRELRRFLDEATQRAARA